jgi:hypothetical protein
MPLQPRVLSRAADTVGYLNTARHSTTLQKPPPRDKAESGESNVSDVQQDGGRHWAPQEWAWGAVLRPVITVFQVVLGELVQVRAGRRVRELCRGPLLRRLCALQRLGAG